MLNISRGTLAFVLSFEAFFIKTRDERDSSNRKSSCIALERVDSFHTLSSLGLQYSQSSSQVRHTLSAAKCPHTQTKHMDHDSSPCLSKSQSVFNPAST